MGNDYQPKIKLGEVIELCWYMFILTSLILGVVSCLIALITCLVLAILLTPGHLPEFIEAWFAISIGFATFGFMFCFAAAVDEGFWG